MSEITYTSLFYTSSPDQRVIMSASHLSTNTQKIKLAYFSIWLFKRNKNET